MNDRLVSLDQTHRLATRRWYWKMMVERLKRAGMLSKDTGIEVSVRRETAEAVMTEREAAMTRDPDRMKAELTQ